MQKKLNLKNSGPSKFVLTSLERYGYETKTFFCLFSRAIRVKLIHRGLDFFLCKKEIFVIQLFPHLQNMWLFPNGHSLTHSLSTTKNTWPSERQESAKDVSRHQPYFFYSTPKLTEALLLISTVLLFSSCDLFLGADKRKCGSWVIISSGCFAHFRLGRPPLIFFWWRRERSHESFSTTITFDRTQLKNQWFRNFCPFPVKYCIKNTGFFERTYWT